MMCLELTIAEYLLAFSDGRTAFSDACIRQASECGRLYCERAENVYMELSFAAVKAGRLLAYTLYSQPSRDAVVLEQMAASADARGSGVVLLPLVYSSDRFFESGYAHCIFAIYEQNTAPNRIRVKLEKEMPFEKKVTRNYLMRNIHSNV